MKDSKIKPMNNPDKIWNYWKKESFVVLLIVISGIAYNVGMLTGPIYQGKLIDGLLQKKSSYKIIILACTFVALTGIVQAFRYMKRFYIRRFANSTSATMRFMLYNNIVHKNQAQLEEEKMGSLMTRAISDVDACVEGMRKFTTEVFDTGVLLLSYLITMLVYDVKITIISSIFIPAAMLIAEKLKQVIYKYTNTYRKKVSELSDVTYDRIDNAILYRITSREEANEEAYKELLQDFEKKAIIANIWENSMQPIYNVIAMTGIIMVFTMGGSNIVKGIWTVGEFSTYITIFTAMAYKASKAAKLFNSVQKAMVSWKRIKPYMQEYADEEEVLETELDENVSSLLTIEQLKFSYPNGNMIIDGLNLKGEAGEIIGVTGPVACGKTTLGRIFLGEYPYEGLIQIKGSDLKDFSVGERSSMVSYLGHNSQLLSDTIYNNITLGDDGDISEVLRMVCFEQDLKAMEKGINTMVGDGGVRLSGGQQARIALARTLYHKNKILILDDPFASVDKTTEKIIFENLIKYQQGTLIILISHRLAVFEQVNSILFMHPDRSYEYGTHTELMESSSMYRELFLLQAAKGGDGDE